MSRRSTALLLVVIVAAFVGLAMTAAPLAALPEDVKVGATLHGLVCIRGPAGTLKGYSAGGPIEVKAVRDNWISIEYHGSQKKTTWLNFDHVISYRTER